MFIRIPPNSWCVEVRIQKATPSRNSFGRMDGMQRWIPIAWLLLGLLLGVAGLVQGQHADAPYNSIPARSFAILKPINLVPSDANQNAQQPYGRILPIAPPATKVSGNPDAKMGAVRKLPALPVTKLRTPQQEFLEDFPDRDAKDSLLPPQEKPQDAQAELPLTNPTPSDENLPEESLLKQREKSVMPYPAPDFSKPAEPVVPLPTPRAPRDFNGFEPESPGDGNLPEPRRLFPLPKIDKPAPPSLSPSLSPTFQNPESFHSVGPPHSLGGTYFASPQFQSLLNPSPSAGRLNPAGNTSWLQNSQPRTLNNPSLQRESLPLKERLDAKRWQLQHARQLVTSNSSTPVTADQTCLVPYQPDDFAPVPYVAQPLDPQREMETYYGKVAIDTQRPWVEWWRPFYTGGMYEPGVPVLSDVNLLTPAFLVYGDYRSGVGIHRNNGQPARSLAHRLNLDMDLRLTGTERFHLFTGPLDHNGRFTRIDFSDNKIKIEEELDFQLDTAFFEGDLGAITGSWLGDDAPFDLPFTCGLVPLLYQNGIWMEDAIAGFAVGAPWKHSRALNWANYEATFFAGFNQVTSPAFNNDNNAAAVYGTAWFVEAYNGYIEADYAFLDDLDKLDRSYHNAAIAYTRRYFGRISNSIRLIGNIGQSGPAINRSADGALLLFENSLISEHPNTFVPYWNCFVGSGRPQSVARAQNAGGILRNTGINFETDALTGYPTLNATASNSYGGAVGLNILSADFRKQLVFEFAALDTYGNPALSSAAGPEYAVGTRYQTALNNRLIWRVDLMNGWFDNAPDIYGTRSEIRWKF